MNTAPQPSPINPTGAPPIDAERLAKHRNELVQTLEWLERLGANPDFRRFMAVTEARLASTEAMASDIDNHDAAKRDAYAQCHFELRTWATWVDRQKERTIAQLKAMDEKQRAL